MNKTTNLIQFIYILVCNFHNKSGECSLQVCECKLSSRNVSPLDVLYFYNHRTTHKQKQTNKQTNKQINKQTNKQTKQTNKQTNRNEQK